MFIKLTSRVRAGLSVFCETALIITSQFVFLALFLTLFSLFPWSDQTPAAMALVATMFTTAIGFGFVWFWIKKRSAQLNFKTLTWSDIFLTLGLFLLHILVAGFFNLILNQVIEVNFDEYSHSLIDESTEDSLLIFVLSFAMIVIIVPIFEEIVFRGFFYSQLRRHFKFMSSFIFSSLFFAVLHLAFNFSWQLNLYLASSIFILSFFITLVYEKTQNLWTAVTFHCLHNFRAFFFLFLTLEDSGNLLLFGF